MSVTSINLQHDLDEALAEIATKTNRSKIWHINQTVKLYVDSLTSEEERWLETLPALEAVKSGRSVPATEVEALLGPWSIHDERQLPEK